MTVPRAKSYGLSKTQSVCTMQSHSSDFQTKEITCYEVLADIKALYVNFKNINTKAWKTRESVAGVDVSVVFLEKNIESQSLIALEVVEEDR